MKYIYLHIKSSTTQIAHYNTFYFLRYVHFRYVECLFSNIQKQYNTLKSSLFFEKNINFPGKQLENSKDSECNIFRILSLYEHKHMERFSNLHYCTFKCFTDIQLGSNEVTSSVAFRVNNRFQTYFINMFSFMCFTCVKLFSFKKICFLRKRLWWTHNLRLNTPEKTMTCSTHNNVLRYSTLSMKHIKVKF